jgi:hypothetical protein
LAWRDVAVHACRVLASDKVLFIAATTRATDPQIDYAKDVVTAWWSCPMTSPARWAGSPISTGTRSSISAYERPGTTASTSRSLPDELTAAKWYD